jgi:DNA polymerase III epsilon subunit-like protein
MNKRINNLLRFNKNQKWLVFDLETEGLNLFSSRPWQLSYIIVQGNDIIEEHDRYLWWPDLKVSDQAALITRFNYAKYKERAEDPKKVLEHFDSYLYDPKILNTGANIIGYDVEVHANLRRLCGKQKDFSYLERLYDVQSLEKAIQLEYTTSQESSPAIFNYKLYHFVKKGLKTSVEFLCKKYEIPYDKEKAHDGLVDVKYVHEILKKQLFQINL